MQKKAFYAIIVIAIITVAAVATYWFATRKPEEHFEKVVKNGDTILVDYIGRLNDSGLVFDTSLTAVAIDNDTYRKDASFEFRSPYQPLNFTVGSGRMIKGFDCGVLGMKEGETKKVTVFPWDGYGNWSWDNVKNVSVEENISKFETISKSNFEALTGELAIENTTFTHWVWNWNATVDSVEGDNVTIEHLRGQPAPNMSYEGLTKQSTKYDWNSTVIFINQTVIKLRHNAVKDMNTTAVGRGKVLNITNQTAPLEDQEIVVDLNFKLAGKILDFEITVLKIEAKE